MSMYTVKRVETPDWTKIEAVELTHQPWLAACEIAAKAQACHDGENLYIRMEAEEKDILATLTGPLDQVCNDSCLEFFFAPKADDIRYFNFEWNKLCNAYVGFGGERKTRVRQILKSPQDVFAPKSFETETGWGIEYRVPASFIQMYMPEFRLEGEAACNFYKCGDKTRTQHYLAWAPLTSEKPDYHRRQDFGRMIFE
ncbi:MAG: carbohydrate-binding family 9-like protein [Clostridia bacterium]|nr:carbohydrate-binding family 9-like protein [Clostridia bacterium]